MSKYNLTDILEQYKIGSGWTTDFDYDGMLNAGLALNAETDVETMKKVVEDFTDVNYHREASHLYDAIEALEKGDAMEAQGRLNDFYIEIKQTMKDQGMDTSDDLGAYMASKMEEGEAVDLAIEASQEKAGIKEGEGPKEEDQRYIDYLRRSGRDEYADKLVALNPTTLKEESFVLDPIKSEMKMHLKAYSDGTIDGDDLYQAFDEIINGGIKPPSERGFNTKYGMEEGFSPEAAKKTVISVKDNPEELKKFLKNLVGGISRGSMKSIDDLRNVLNAMEEEGIKLDEIAGYDRKGNKQQDTDGSDATKFKKAAMSEKTDMDVPEKPSIIRALKVDANGTSVEIKSYLESLKRSGDKFDSVDDYVEDFKNYVADKSLQEHFKRFM